MCLILSTHHSKGQWKLQKPITPLIQAVLSHGKVCRTGIDCMTHHIRLPAESHSVGPIVTFHTCQWNTDFNPHTGSNIKCHHGLLEQLAEPKIRPLLKATQWAEKDHQETHKHSCLHGNKIIYLMTPVQDKRVVPEWKKFIQYNATV